MVQLLMLLVRLETWLASSLASSLASLLASSLASSSASLLASSLVSWLASWSVSLSVVELDPLSVASRVSVLVCSLVGKLDPWREAALAFLSVSSFFVGWFVSSRSPCWFLFSWGPCRFLCSWGSCWLLCSWGPSWLFPIRSWVGQDPVLGCKAAGSFAAFWFENLVADSSLWGAVPDPELVSVIFESEVVEKLPNPVLPILNFPPLLMFPAVSAFFFEGSMPASTVQSQAMFRQLSLLSFLKWIYGHEECDHTRTNLESLLFFWSFPEFRHYEQLTTPLSLCLFQSATDTPNPWIPHQPV